jgi:hypothetical protein
MSCLFWRARAWQVTAGTVVFEAPLTIRAASTGAGSTLAGISRLVAAAQVRCLPVPAAAGSLHHVALRFSCLDQGPSGHVLLCALVCCGLPCHPDLGF